MRYSDTWSYAYVGGSRLAKTAWKVAIAFGVLLLVSVILHYVLEWFPFWGYWAVGFAAFVGITIAAAVAAYQNRSGVIGNENWVAETGTSALFIGTPIGILLLLFSLLYLVTWGFYAAINRVYDEWIFWSVLALILFAWTFRQELYDLIQSRRRNRDLV